MAATTNMLAARSCVSEKSGNLIGLGASTTRELKMCDYSLHNVKSRPAKIGDKLTTRDFGMGTTGFAAAEDANMAVCVMPGTELSFADEIRCVPSLFAWRGKRIKHRTAIFRQVHKGNIYTHHDALECPDGRIVLLTSLCEGQHAVVLQLPAEPRTAADAATQPRLSPVI